MIIWRMQGDDPEWRLAAIVLCLLPLFGCSWACGVGAWRGWNAGSVAFVGFGSWKIQHKDRWAFEISIISLKKGPVGLCKRPFFWIFSFWSNVGYANDDTEKDTMHYFLGINQVPLFVLEPYFKWYHSWILAFLKFKILLSSFMYLASSMYVVKK